MPKLDITRILSDSIPSLLLKLLISIPLSIYTLTSRTDFYFDVSKYFAYLNSFRIIAEIFALSFLFFVILSLLEKKQSSSLLNHLKPLQRIMVFSILFLFLIISIFLLLIKHTAIYLLCLNSSIMALIIFFAGVIFTGKREFAVLKKDATNNKLVFFFVLLFIFTIIIFLFYKTFSFHRAFFTQARDTGLFLNVMWNILNSNSQFTCLEGFIDHRSTHFQPILYLLAPFVLLKDDSATLFFLQSLFLGVSCLYMYKLAGLLLKNNNASFFIMLAYFINPYFYRIADYNFQPSFIYTAAFLAFLYYVEREKFLPACVSAIAALSVKEELAIYTFFLLLFASFRKKDKRFLFLALGVLLYTIIVLFIIIPHYNKAISPHLEWVVNRIINPATYLDLGKWFELFFFFTGVLFLGIYPSTAFVLLLLPPLVIQFTNYDPDNYLFFWYHSAVVLPALFAVFMFNYNKLFLSGQKPNSHRVLPVCYFILILQSQYHVAYTAIQPLFASIIAVIILIIFPYVYFNEKKILWLKWVLISCCIFIYFIGGYGTFFNYRLKLTPPNDRETIRQAINFLPSENEIPVITNSNIVPHVSKRKYIDLIEKDNPEDLLKSAIISKNNVFYVLEYWRAYTYQKINPVIRNNEILRLALEYGFQYEQVFQKNDVSVKKFFKITPNPSKSQQSIK